MMNQAIFQFNKIAVIFSVLLLISDSDAAIDKTRVNETECWTIYNGVCVTDIYGCPNQLVDTKLYPPCNYPPRSRCCRPKHKPKVEPFVSKKCGFAPLAATDSAKKLSIFHGVVAKPHSYPWMVSITISLASRYAFFCSGMLIDKKWVLTAAHCVYGKSIDKIVVFAGEDYSISKDDQFRKGVQATFIKRYIVHQLYSSTTYENDIALIELKLPVLYTNQVQPICLPNSKVTNYAEIYTVSGFGLMNNFKFSAKMMSTHLPSVDLQECASLQENAIFESNICAGFHEGGRDTCKGDSGGPLSRLAVDDDGVIRTIAAGIVSWGDWCGKLHKPGVYTDIKKYLDWIDFITRLPLAYPDGRYSNAEIFTLRNFKKIIPTK